MPSHLSTSRRSDLYELAYRINLQVRKLSFHGSDPRELDCPFWEDQTNARASAREVVNDELEAVIDELKTLVYKEKKMK